MKKLRSASLTTVLLFITAAAALAATKVTIHEKPVTLIQEGEVFVVPEQTATRYYYHTVNNNRYICAVEEPMELVGTDAMMVDVKIAGEPKTVRCYPETNFNLE